MVINLVIEVGLADEEIEDAADVAVAVVVAAVADAANVEFVEEVVVGGVLFETWRRNVKRRHPKRDQTSQTERRKGIR